MLKLKNIRKTYEVAGAKFEALKGLNICFRKNEFVSILGPSGCGKTTTLNIIGGLDKYTSGDLIIAGKSTKEFKDRDWDVYRNHRVGFIFQSYNLIPHQTIEENVELALTIAGVTKEERKKRAREALDRVGLKGSYNKKPNQLSGGQCQRVAIARALINNPEILLADEPTGALDTKTSIQIMELIKEISKDTLVIMVTHNPELAHKYSTRIVSLLDGEIVEDSNPYSEEDEAKEATSENADFALEKAKMSFRTAFKLSFKNLLSKKKRTILTIIAGSIGIIGISAVLAVSNGVKTYIKDMQNDMLSGNPIKVSQNSLDYSSLMSMMTNDEKKQFIDENGYVNVNSMVEYMAKKYAQMSEAEIKNDITEDYIKYLKAMPSDYAADINFNYGIDITNNIYTTHNVHSKNESDNLRSVTAITATYTELLSKTSLKDFVSVISSMSSPVGQSLSNTDYIRGQYDIHGSIATSYDEVMLVLDNDKTLTDILLAELGYYTQDEFLNIAYKATNDENYNSNLDKDKFSYDELLNHEFYYIDNDHAYIQTSYKEGIFQYNYNAKDVAGSDMHKLKVVGILTPKDDVSYGCLKTGFYYTKAFTERMLSDSKNSKIVNYMKNHNNEISVPIKYIQEPSLLPSLEEGVFYNLGYEYDGKAQSSFKILGTTGGSSLSSMMSGNAVDVSKLAFTLGINNVGGSSLATDISIYPTDFKAKDKVLEYLDAWNGLNDITVGDKVLTYKDRKEVKYTDNLSLIISMIDSMLNMVTIALIAFTCLSLVVSCVMIAIITYVSVVERVKEIGVIRSLGGRKKDVNNLFNAETIMTGLSCGVFGVAVTYLLQGIMNLVVETLSGIPNIMLLSPTTAIIMIALSVLLTVLSGALPASKASHQDPVEALRSE